MHGVTSEIFASVLLNEHCYPSTESYFSVIVVWAKCGNRNPNPDPNEHCHPSTESYLSVVVVCWTICVNRRVYSAS